MYAVFCGPNLAYTTCALSRKKKFNLGQWAAGMTIWLIDRTTTAKPKLDKCGANVFIKSRTQQTTEKKICVQCLVRGKWENATIEL